MAGRVGLKVMIRLILVQLKLDLPTATELCKSIILEDSSLLTQFGTPTEIFTTIHCRNILRFKTSYIFDGDLEN